MSKTISEIRKQTRLALPEDDTYLYRLGVALYGFASVNSFMIEIICAIDTTQSKTILSGKVSGEILNIFRQTLNQIKKQKKFPKIYNEMKSAADIFEKLNTERTDFVHAYPITSSIDKKTQILHRRQDEKKKYFEVDDKFLDNFICRLHTVSDELYKIRNVINNIP